MILDSSYVSELTSSEGSGALSELILCLSLLKNR